MLICPICETDPVEIEHHVIPASRGGGRIEPVPVCLDCGNQVHMLFTNKELAFFGSLTILLGQSAMLKYIEWKKKHPGIHTYKSSKKLREWKKFHRG